MFWKCNSLNHADCGANIKTEQKAEQNRTVVMIVYYCKKDWHKFVSNVIKVNEVNDEDHEVNADMAYYEVVQNCII